MRKVRYLLNISTIIFIVIIASPLVSHGAARTPPVEAGLEKVIVKVPAKWRKRPFIQKRSLYAPAGFKVSVFASGFMTPRFMAVGPDGFIYLSLPREGKIVVLPDRDHDGAADEVIVYADGLDSPHGLVFRGGDLIVAETGALVLLKDTNGDHKADVKKVITKEIPYGGGHWTRTVVMGPDRALYVSVGSSCNVCVEKERRRATVLRFAGGEGGGKGKIFASGLRNSVGITFDFVSGELWGVDNGRDWLGNDLPPEELNNIKEGGDFGWPFCYGDKTPDPDYGSVERCKGTIPPAVKMQAHSAPLGITFGKGLNFPEKYKEGLFVAFHGSWNRTVPTGYKLVTIPFKKGRPAAEEPVDFITGWLTDYHVWGRPVDPVVGADGALYLSDDKAGAVYRIVYEGTGD